jgi:hypothetical protein
MIFATPQRGDATTANETNQPRCGVMKGFASAS